MAINTTTSKAIIVSIIISFIVSTIIVLGFIISGHFKPVDVKTDAFIGIISTFIGIIVTLAIGFQIYNAIELKKEIHEAKSKTENILEEFKASMIKVEDLNKNFNKLEAKLEQEKKKIEYLSSKQVALFNYSNGQYNLSLMNSISTLNMYLKDNSLDDKNDIIGLIISTIIKCYEKTNTKEYFNFIESNIMKTTQDEDIKNICRELYIYNDYIHTGEHPIEELIPKYISSLKERFSADFLLFNTGCPF